MTLSVRNSVRQCPEHHAWFARTGHWCDMDQGPRGAQDAGLSPFGRSKTNGPHCGTGGGWRLCATDQHESPAEFGARLVVVVGVAASRSVHKKRKTPPCSHEKSQRAGDETDAFLFDCHETTPKAFAIIKQNPFTYFMTSLETV